MILKRYRKYTEVKGIREMKKVAKSLLVMILGLLMSVNVMADVQTGKTEPDYPTDYYMIVESKDGGIDIYSQPDFDSTRLNDAQIPNGTALHIEGEVEDTENNRTWGYTEYHGMYGYAPLDECRPADSRKEAIDSELYLAGKDNVNYNTDYDVTAYAEDGSQKLYQGPGTKYGEVPGVRDIENGEKLHITEDAEMVDGSNWGVTTIDGTEGWVDLQKTEEWRKEHPETEETSAPAVAGAEDSDMVDMQAADGEGAEVSVTPTVTAAPTKKPTATPTEKAKATATPVPTETAAPTPTKEPKATDTPAPTETEAAATDTPAPTATEAATETPEPSEEADQKDEANAGAEDENSRQASGQNVEAAKSSCYQNPFIWIAVIAVLAVAGLLIYHNKKK